MALSCSLLFPFLLLFSSALCLDNPIAPDLSPPLQDVMLGMPISLRNTMGTYIEMSPGVRRGELIFCIRMRVPSISRLKNIRKYAHSFRVKLIASTRTIHQSSQKVDICFHGNKSLALGQCSKEAWQLLEKGSWNGVMSPFETKYIDVRIRGSIMESPLTISVDEEFWPFRLVFLGCGLVLLLVAPIISDWVPFYYSSAMLLGVFLIVLILLFQGMKFLPTGRKSTLYILLYGSVVGMGTVVMRYFTGLVSSLLEEFGISNEAYNPVGIFVIVGIVLMGAWLGYWGVRKLVLSEDGSVDAGTAQFVKWAIRIVASIMILQSSHDPLLAAVALVFGVSLTWTIKKLHLHDLIDIYDGMISFLLQHTNNLPFHRIAPAPGQAKFQRKIYQRESERFSKTEFLSKSDVLLTTKIKSPYQPSTTLSRRLEQISPRIENNNAEDHYSSFHKMPFRKHMTPKEWSNFTQQHTRKAVQELTSSSEFSDWFVKNTDRVVILPTEHREDRSNDEIQTTAYMQQDDRNEDDVRKSWFFGL